ncbi:MAG: ABC-F family ATP-binding cassette domain-containing protein [Anaerolineales bacterium]|nr:ABC-F family ATP-binding cassette domain-containing protein [Anaerolineales bacterium]
MSLLTGTQLAKSYGPDDIFAGVDIAIPHMARIGLVGPNGAGKTTLLRLLAGREEPSRGMVQAARGLRIGYLAQEAALEAASLGATVWDEMLGAFAGLREREAELARLEAAMADPAQRDSLLERYGPLQHQFELDGGYLYETRIRQVLSGLNFEPADYVRPVEQLSGGQKTRALLGRLLLESPDLLILDEPTNHLDIHAVEWLETWLNDWDGAVLIVSHDRYFLDQVVSSIWELAFEALTEYRGNYSAYLAQRADRRSRQQNEYAAQRALMAKEQGYIRRNIAGQNTRQAKGRQRRLDRLMVSGAGLVDRPREAAQLKLDLQTYQRSGDRVIETHDLAVGYADDGKVLFHAPDVLLWREECAALIGPNGAGKTTFLKTLLGEVSPLAGSVTLGSSLKIGYFAQAHEGLDPERTVLDELLAVQEMPTGRARDYAAKFLFTGDDVYKKISVLSGGERGRVALAKLALQGANLLLLDEPTNHLDIPSQEILQAVLADFPGTILLVSHDRYLIDGLATQIWSVEAGALEVFKGSWGEYVKEREKGTEPAKEAGWAAVGAAKARGEKAAVPSRPPRGNAEQKRERSAERKRAARLAEAERAITDLEQRLAALARELEEAGTAGDAVRVGTLGEAYNQLQTELTVRLGEWEALAV